LLASKSVAMKTLAKQFFLSAFLLTSFVVFSGFTFPKDPVKGDSLVIVRVLSPVSFEVQAEPVVFVSKGLNKIEKVEVQDTHADAGLMKTDPENTVQGFINTGFSLENATRVTSEGFQLSTFYLKKKAI